MQKKLQMGGPNIPTERTEISLREETVRESFWATERQSDKKQSSKLDGTELFSKFTADIIKEDVFFTR